MNMRKTEIIVLVIILLAFVAGIYFYPQVPAQMASHWDAQGQVNGYMAKFWGLFLMPLILVVLALLFVTVPIIDPLKINIEKFRKYYNTFIVLLFVFMIFVHFQIILWNLGIKISPNAVLPAGLGLLFFYTGILCEHAKRNWFIGIRTPWTLSSEKVWEKTHKIGGKLFKVVGIVTFIGIFFQKYAVIFIIVPVILVTAYAYIYSYLEYKKEQR